MNNVTNGSTLLPLGPIKNACNTSLQANSGTVPNVIDAILDLFQQMTFQIIKKSVVAFQVQELSTNVNFYGMWQTPSGRRLEMMPHGQRVWKTHTLYSDTTLMLKPDDIVTYLGKQYRVLVVEDWSLSGYMRYDLIQDYTGPVPLATSVPPSQYLETESGQPLLTEGGSEIGLDP